MPAPAPVETFRLLQGVLSQQDLRFLKHRCQEYIGREDSIPSYVLLDILDMPTCQKIMEALREETGQELLYLNDFYLYSQEAAGAGWHMDTELFTFDDCINAWILLSPDEIRNPLAMLEKPNDSPEDHFHGVKIEGDACSFVNYRTGCTMEMPLAELEAAKIETPVVHEGDILLLNPKKFHKTNTTIPKHALVLKFVVKGKDDLFSGSKVPSIFWSEVGLFTGLLKTSENWDDFLAGLGEALKTPEGRKALSAGFFPERMDLYRKMVVTL